MEHTVRKYQLKVLFTTATFCALCSLAFLVVQHGGVDAWFLPGSVFGGFLAAAGICALRFAVMPRLIGFPLLVSIVLGALGYLVVLLATFSLTAIFTQLVFNGGNGLAEKVAGTLFSQDTRVGFLWACVGVFIVSASVQLAGKLGPGVLWRWFIGSYRVPRVEERVFLLVDLNDSTQLAESLDDLKFSSLVRDFLNEVSVLTHRHRGEVAGYVGDGALITWQLRDMNDRAHCLRLVIELESSLRERSAAFLEQYGISPGFKAGAHCGPAVVTEVGRICMDFVYHGDTVNAAARIASLCSNIGSQFLVSGAILNQLDLPGALGRRTVGRHELRGKTEMLELFEISRTTTQS